MEKDVALERGFLGLLTEQAEEYFLSLPQDFLSQTQQERLQRITDHFGNATNLNNQAVLIKDQSDEPEEKAKGRGRPSISWKAIRDIQELKLDAKASSLLRILKGDASEFLNERLKTAPTPTSGSAWEILSESQNYSESIQDSNVNETIYYLFWILLVGDMANMILGEGVPITKELLQEQEARTYESAGSNKTSKGKSPIVSSKQLTNRLKIIKRGTKMAWLCDKFGTGYVFFLHKTLTPNFIDNRWTQSGGAFEEAMAHLKDLGLCEKRKDSGANELGDSIRAYLRSRYDVDRFETNPVIHDKELMEIDSDAS